MPEPRATMSIGGTPVIEPTRQRSPRFEVNGVDIGAQDIINEGNARRSSFTPQALQEAAGSQIDASAAAEQDTRLADPVTSWFSYGPMDPDMYENYKSMGAVDQFEEAFARRYSQWKPQTVEDYIKMGDTFIQSTPEMAPFVKRRMLEAMPANIKAEYEEKSASAKAKRQMMEQLKLQEFEREYISKRLPKGWSMGPDGKTIPDYKAEEGELSSRVKLVTAIGNLSKAIEIAEDPKTKAGLQRQLNAFANMLPAEQAATATGKVMSQAEMMADFQKEEGRAPTQGELDRMKAAGLWR